MHVNNIYGELTKVLLLCKLVNLMLTVSVICETIIKFKVCSNMEASRISGVDPGGGAIAPQ